MYRNVQKYIEMSRTVQKCIEMYRNVQNEWMNEYVQKCMVRYRKTVRQVQMTLSVIWPTSGAQYIFIEGVRDATYIQIVDGGGGGGQHEGTLINFSPIQDIYFQPPVFNLSPYFKSIMTLFCPLTLKLVYISPLIPLYVNPSVRPCNIIKRIVLNICQFCCF